MSVFSKIKDAIFGKKAAAARPAAQARQTTAMPQHSAAPAPAASAGQARPAAPVPPPSRAPAPAASASAPQQATQVDVEAVLSDLAARSDQKLNWQTSIVDLMKLLGLDSSLDERKQLARELGYTGALDGSAEMNIWLHKRVMRELAANGGKVPPALLN